MRNLIKWVAASEIVFLILFLFVMSAGVDLVQYMQLLLCHVIHKNPNKRERDGVSWFKGLFLRQTWLNLKSEMTTIRPSHNELVLIGKNQKFNSNNFIWFNLTFQGFG